jgi:hypothetical protein
VKTAVLQMSAWQRRLATVLVPVAILGAVGSVGYVSGGPRLHGGVGGVSGPAAIGEEFHAMAELDTGGHPITILRAHAVGVAGNVEVRTTLVRLNGNNPIGSSRGPLPSEYEPVRLPAEVTAFPHARALYAFDVALLATAPGTASVAGIEVTYTAGLLRTRTATLYGSVCIHGSGNWRTDRSDFSRSCPSH